MTFEEAVKVIVETPNKPFGQWPPTRLEQARHAALLEYEAAHNGEYPETDERFEAWLLTRRFAKNFWDAGLQRRHDEQHQSG